MTDPRSQRLAGQTFAVQVPSGWSDITSTLESDAPWTLARDQGGCVLQFTVASYKRGKTPNPTVADLASMVRTFGHSRGFGEPSQTTTEVAGLLLAAGTFVADESFLRVWYLSDGRNFAFATYLADPGEAEPGLRESEAIVRTLELTNAEAV